MQKSHNYSFDSFVRHNRCLNVLLIAYILKELYAKRRSGIEVKLMAREEESEDIDTRGDPAVVRILHVATVRHFIEMIQRGKVRTSQRKILH